jgi:hypothetical protein
VALADAPPAASIVAEPPVARAAPYPVAEPVAPLVDASRVSIAEPAPPSVTEPVRLVEPTSFAKPEVVAPAALAGPLEVRPRAANANVVSPVQPETEMPSAVRPEIPSSRVAPSTVLLDHAPRISYLAGVEPMSSPWRSRAGRLEIRDFTRTAPILELRASLAEPLIEKTALPQKIALAPVPSRNGAALRAEPPQDFRDGKVQIGEIAVLDLPTTGFETSGEYASAPAEIEEGEGTSAPEAIAIPAAEPDVPAKTGASDTASPSDFETPPAEHIAPADASEPETVSLPELATEQAAPSVIEAPPAAEHITPLEASEPVSIPESLVSIPESLVEQVPFVETPASEESAAVEILAEPVVDPVGEPVTPLETSEPEPAEIFSTGAPGPEAEADSSTAQPADAPVADAPIVYATAEPVAVPVDAMVAPATPEPRLTPETQASPEPEPSAETERSFETDPSAEVDLALEAPPAQQAPGHREPARGTEPVPLVHAAIPAGKAKPLQIFTSTLKADIAGQLPRHESLPLRATMVLGRADAPVPKASPAKAEPAEAESSKLVPAKTDKPKEAANEQAAKEPATKPAVKWPAPRVRTEPVGAKVVEPAKAAPAAITKTPADAPPVKSANAKAAVPEPVPPRAEPAKPLVAVRIPAGSERELAEVNREQAKLNREQAELNRAQAELNREQARRNRELAKTAEKVAATSMSSAAGDPSGAKGNKPGSLTSLSLNGAPQTAVETDLGLPALDLKNVNRFPLRTKIVAAAVGVLLVSGIGFFATRNRAKAPETFAVSSLSGGAGPEWQENFSPDAKHPRTISILRASEKYTDYSIDFNASVDVKALGWVFRAKDPANFYVARIEQEKTLAGMAAAFVYFPVVNGVPQPRKRSSVALPAAPGTIYRIRFDVFGDQFTAWIQDRKVEEWTDSSLRSGGAGLYSESGERALLQGPFRVIPRTAAR